MPFASRATQQTTKSAAQLLVDSLRDHITNRWEPLPWQRPVLADRSPIIVLTGSAGGGKSDVGTRKCHQYMLDYPGAFGLMVRKTRASMIAGTVLQYEQIIGNDAEHFPSKSMFVYHNGSIVVYGGMKDRKERQKLRSIGRKGGVDFLLVEEGSELEQPDWNELGARMRGKAGPYQQAVVMTNPDAPTHWINRLLIIGGQAKVYYSRASQNPHNPPGYNAWLERLTGLERKRLVEGLWVQAEGVVFDAYNAEVNLIDRFPIPDSWQQLGSVDFGWDNPTCAQWWAIDDDGRMFMHREIYRSHLEVDDLSDMILAHYNGFPWYYDYASGIRLGKGIVSLSANKSVDPGIRTVNSRMRPAGDGRPRLFIFRDALCHPPDPRLVDSHRPVCTAEEIDGYVWEIDSRGVSTGKPLKRNDHGCDAMRYAGQAASAGRPFIVVNGKVIY